MTNQCAVLFMLTNTDMTSNLCFLFLIYKKPSPLEISSGALVSLCSPECSLFWVMLTKYLTENKRIEDVFGFIF